MWKSRELRQERGPRPKTGTRARAHVLPRVCEFGMRQRQPGPPSWSGALPHSVNVRRRMTACGTATAAATRPRPPARAISGPRCRAPARVRSASTRMREGVEDEAVRTARDLKRWVMFLSQGLLRVGLRLPRLGDAQPGPGCPCLRRDPPRFGALPTQGPERRARRPGRGPDSVLAVAVAAGRHRCRRRPARAARQRGSPCRPAEHAGRGASEWP